MNKLFQLDMIIENAQDLFRQFIKYAFENLVAATFLEFFVAIRFNTGYCSDVYVIVIAQKLSFDP